MFDNHNSNWGGKKKPYKSNYNGGTNKPQYPKRRKEDLRDVISRRNSRLEKLFQDLGLNIRLIGDENTPAMILDNAYILNAYVHNFELRFTDKPYDGSVIYSIKLTEYPSYDKRAIEEAIYEYGHRTAYKVRLLNTAPELYLSGYNFLNKSNRDGRYPVFSVHNPKVYFTQEKAQEVAKEITDLGYQVSIE